MPSYLDTRTPRARSVVSGQLTSPHPSQARRRYTLLPTRRALVPALAPAPACGFAAVCLGLAGKPRLAALFSTIPCRQPYKTHTVHLNNATKRNKAPVVDSNNQRAHVIPSNASDESTSLTAAPCGNCTSRHPGSPMLRSRRCVGLRVHVRLLMRTQLRTSWV